MRGVLSRILRDLSIYVLIMGIMGTMIGSLVCLASRDAPMALACVVLLGCLSLGVHRALLIMSRLLAPRYRYVVHEFRDGDRLVEQVRG